MAAKATTAASDKTLIEAALANLERALETAKGSRRKELQKWVTDVKQVLKKLESHTLH